MQNKCLVLGAAFLFAASSMFAQVAEVDYSKDDKLCFNHLDVAVTAGSTGIGLDVAMPVCKIVQVRAGFTYMPHIFSDSQFGIQIGDEPGTKQEQKEKFDKMVGFVEQYLGTKIDQYIDMKRTPNMNNFKFLVDVFPFKNKKWHVTGGFYWGPSVIAKAENAAIDGTSLVGVTMYNKFYDAAVNDEPIYNNVYLDPSLADKFIKYGRMSVHLGNFKGQVDENGNPMPYRLVPNADNMIVCKLKVNSFKPYLGFGYGGALSKRSDTYHLSFDCGAMFWGGTPHLYTHDGIDLIHDVENVQGKVGDNVKFFRALKVFPVLELRFSRKIF